MVLMQFSEVSHLPLLLDGRKRQTTRQPRVRKIVPGDTLQCYYKPRMKKECRNCIDASCEWAVLGTSEMVPNIKCNKHTNFIGEATVLDVMTAKFFLLTDGYKNMWARSDGFKDFAEADAWFTERYGEGWQGLDWVIITFHPTWVVQ